MTKYMTNPVASTTVVISGAEISAGSIFTRCTTRGIKAPEECLSRVILFGERSLGHVLTEYGAYYHRERPHQGKGNMVLMPVSEPGMAREGPLQCRERLGGLLKYSHREAA